MNRSALAWVCLGVAVSAGTGGCGGDGATDPRILVVRATVPMGATSGRIELADIDCDGRLDLVSLDAETQSVATRRAPAAVPRALRGAFAPAYLGVRHSLVWDSRSEFAVADFDRDGRPDLVVAGGSNAELYLLRRPSLEAEDFQALPPLPTAGAADALAIGDFDRDGAPDFATLDETSGAVSLLLTRGAPPGTWLPSPGPALGGPASDLVAGDFDRDGRLDLATLDPTASRLAVFLQDAASGAGGFALLPVDLPAPPGSTLVAGDLDGDGDLDFVCTTADRRRLVLVSGTTGPGSSRVSSYDPIVLDLKGDRCAIGDLDRDGRPDLVTVGRQAGGGSLCQVAFGPLLAGVVPVHVALFDSSEDLADVRIGDLTGDGTPDVALSNATDGTIEAFLQVPRGGGDPDFDLLRTSAPPGDPGDVALADVDGDGTLDLVACGTGGTSVTFAPRDGPPVVVLNDDRPVAFARVATGDVTGDGAPDLLVADPTSVRIRITPRDAVGNRTFAPPLDVPLPFPPRAVAVGDLDRDGNLDLVACGEGMLAVFANPFGDGTAFVPVAFLPLRGAGDDLAVADLDCDDRLDVVVAHEGARLAEVFLQEAGPAPDVLRFQFSEPVQFAAGRRVAVGDLTGDGRPDLAFVDHGGVVVVTDGPDFFFGQMRVSDAPAADVAVGDVDGDGRLDLVTADVDGDGFHVLLEDLDAPDLRRTLAVPHALDRPGVAVALGDVDGDGRLDVVVAAGAAPGAAASVFTWTQTGGPR